MVNFDKAITILGIESSCDETSAAVLQNNRLLSNEIATQKLHEHYGGVVPELASREHMKNIVPVVDVALTKAITDIDAIAYTRGPGLLGALFVGSNFAKALSIGLGKPLLEVHHMQAHILAHFIQFEENQSFPEFPFICLTVSGGHTQLILVHNYLQFEIIGETIDDAAGEAFDKAAKMLGIPYPGGPLIDQYAQNGNPNQFSFAKPRVGEFQFSFSGLKTSILYFLKDQKLKNELFIQENLNDLCASIQKTIVDILIEKLQAASKKYGVKHIALAGGVSANSLLRVRIKSLELKGYKTFIPKFEFCTDNAAMIAITGYYKYLQGEFGKLSNGAKAKYEF
jgi:N6-L-threonylcarbamoyladenine synthase